MPSNYSRNLGLELIATGEQPGTWGETTNVNLRALDDAIDGIVDVAVTAGGVIITTEDAPAISQGRSKVLRFHGDIGVNPSATVTISPNDAEKWYFVLNECTRPLVFSQGSGATYTVDAGYSAVIHCNGTGAAASVYGTLSSVQMDKVLVRGVVPGTGMLTVSGTLNVTGVATLSGAVTMQNTLTVAGHTALNTTLTVAGAVTFQHTLNVNGMATLGGLSVTTDAILNGTLTVVGPTTLGNTVAIVGKLTAGAVSINVGSDATWDMYARSASGDLARIPPGVSGQYLRAGTGGQPSWQALTLAINTPLTGAFQGEVLFNRDNALARGRLVFDWPNATLEITAGPGTGSSLYLDGETADVDHGIVFRSAGFTRWRIGTAGLPGHTQALYAQRYSDAGVALGISFIMARSTGHVMIGSITTDYGAALNISPHVVGEPGVIVRRKAGQIASLLMFHTEGGAPLSYFDASGVYNGPVAFAAVESVVEQLAANPGLAERLREVLRQ